MFLKSGDSLQITKHKVANFVLRRSDAPKRVSNGLRRFSCFVFFDLNRIRLVGKAFYEFILHIKSEFLVKNIDKRWHIMFTLLTKIELERV